MSDTQLPAIVDQDKPSNLPALAQQAIESGNVEIAERAFALIERFEERQAQAALVEALQGVQRECPPIEKTQPVYGKAKGDQKHGPLLYRFPPYKDVLAHIQPYMEKWGLSFKHSTRIVDGTKMMVCTVMHKSGAKTESEVPMVMVEGTSAQNSMQKWASAGSMAKRYSLIDALGLATFDDDGQSSDLGISPSDLGALFSAFDSKYGSGDDEARRTAFREWCRANVFGGTRSDQQLRDPAAWTRRDYEFATQLVNRVSFEDFAAPAEPPPSPSGISDTIPPFERWKQKIDQQTTEMGVKKIKGDYAKTSGMSFSELEELDQHADAKIAQLRSTK